MYPPSRVALKGGNVHFFGSTFTTSVCPIRSSGRFRPLPFRRATRLGRCASSANVWVGMPSASRTFFRYSTASTSRPGGSLVSNWTSAWKCCSVSCSTLGQSGCVDWDSPATLRTVTRIRGTCRMAFQLSSFQAFKLSPSLHDNVSTPIPILILRAERLRQLDQIVEDLLAELRIGEHRTAALARGAAVAGGDRGARGVAQGLALAARR